MKKIGVIDIGTNSMRMLICQLRGEQVIESNRTIRTTRLGQGIDKNGFIQPDAYERNFGALKALKGIAKKEQVEHLIVFGTSALRDAKNSLDFTRTVKKELDLTIDILSGQKEAALGFKGATQDYPEEALVIDIGGGSTELILGDTLGGVEKAYSLNIGALRMTEIYIKSHPIPEEEMAAMEDGIRKTLGSILSSVPRDRIKTFIGIGGTITTLSAIKQELREYDRQKIHGSLLTLRDIEGIHEKLLALSIEERKEVPGLHPGRADIIVAGISILKCIMEGLNLHHLTISEKDNLDGMVVDYLEKNKRQEK